MNNYVFIDGQNLYLGISTGGWKMDLRRFRVYLKEKYNVSKAFYFIGYKTKDNENLYSFLESAGYTLIFREHNALMFGNKKGNVDSDIVFEVCRSLIDQEYFDKIVLVSGDGDYKKMVKYLISKNRFHKILFPNKKFASSLYKDLTSKYYDYLDAIDVKKKVGL